MTSFDRNVEYKYAIITLMNGKVIHGFINDIDYDEDGESNTDRGAISVSEPGGEFNLYFPEEVKSIELLPPRSR
ncbi:hypothetical protein [Allobaculum mucilyticum]|uniref:hypothetical protein n=1 Tax=Allobaculum mucilyticum TaxID=2834459 RepID=UPI001E3C6E14|nr:hypothetical protein [Allobaculum mucilyticum]UNT97136.1 hypothetical protein KWG62_05145 [Allobaculum mucilyticum]